MISLYLLCIEIKTDHKHVKFLQVRTSYLPSEIRWGECLVPLMAFRENDGKYCIDFTQFDNTTKVQKPHPRCSAKAWHERCQKDTSDGATVKNSESCASFKSKTESTPPQPSQRGGKGKRQRKGGTQQSAKSGKSYTRSYSCTAMDHTRQVFSSSQRLKPNASSAVTLNHYQPASPVRRQGSETRDDSDSDIPSPQRKLLKEDSRVGGRVRFQQKDMCEDGLGSVNDLSFA